MADEKLAPGGIGVLRAGHRKHATGVRFLVELGRDLVARIARPPARLFAFVFRQRIAALDHEAFDHAMERRPIVESGFRQLLEILHGLRRHVRPKFGHHFAFAGFNDCYFLWFTHDDGIFLFFLFLLASPRRGDERQPERAAKQHLFHGPDPTVQPRTFNRERDSRGRGD